MEISNDIVLRPRFKLKILANNNTVLENFEVHKKTQTKFIISRVDDHVFVRFPKKDQHFWSPQLHLEINKEENNHSIVHGLFGPTPTVWTLFIFLHFVVAVLCLGFGVWAYTSANLGNAFILQLCLSLLMILIWFLLYLAGRIGRTKGKQEMYLLHHFMEEILKTYR
ncbi:GTP-binding protein [Winogradskyella wichelsiae]|uniref:GTP-binding protein n=1 Tax=Winogradskyella wichelsiae TaxID=2697007 RepID=UPI003EF797C0